MAFRGHYEHSLDSKDRLTVPARFRVALSDGVVISKGIDPCVAVFTPDGFDRFTSNFLDPVNPLGARGRQLRRHFHGNSFDDKLDSAGRIRLPRKLIEHAGLGGSCVVIGMSDHFEVWDAERWAAYEPELDAGVAEAAEAAENPAAGG